MCKKRGAGGEMWLEAWQGGVGLGLELGEDEVGVLGGGATTGVAGGTQQATSGSSMCGQVGCQALGLWIAGDCLRGVWGEAEEEDE